MVKMVKKKFDSLTYIFKRFWKIWLRLEKLKRKKRRITGKCIQGLLFENDLTIIPRKMNVDINF